MTQKLVIFALATAALFTDARRGLAEAPPANAIVSAADKVRNPQQPFRMTLTLVEYIKGQSKDVVTLTVHSKIDGQTRQFKNIVRYVAPPRDVGKLVLLNASSMWFYDPASKASIRISPQQRLTGQASDGDVLTVNLARDFTPRVVGEERIQDADRTERATWHLDLAAATTDAMYPRLETWIEKDTYRVIKAKFYSDSGRLLKIAYYRRYEERLGTARPTETIIIDAVDSNLVTKISYTDFRVEEVQDAWFSRDYLPQFREE
jgi:hypothetical protein